jgi:ABC-2 type transport system permease protein
MSRPSSGSRAPLTRPPAADASGGAPGGAAGTSGARARGSARRPMSLWRLEVQRLIRSRRWIALLGVYAFFGLTGPMVARYMGEILERFGGELQVIVPDPVPADGLTQYLGNAAQIGLLVVLVVAAGALALDGIPELSAFLRTRASIPRLLVPRYVVSTLAAWAAFAVGMLAAWYETEVLIGSLPLVSVLGGTALSWLYLAFAVAVVAAASGLLRGALGIVATAAGVLLVLPAVGLLGIGEWLPSHLVGAPDALARGAALGDFARAAGVTVAATALLLVAAVGLLGRREL